MKSHTTFRDYARMRKWHESFVYVSADNYIRFGSHCVITGDKSRFISQPRCEKFDLYIEGYNLFLVSFEADGSIAENKRHCS